MNHNEEENEFLLDEEETVEESHEDTNPDSIIVISKMKELIKAVASHEELDIQFGDGSIEKLQEAFRFISVSLTYELIDILKKNNRKRLTPLSVDQALTKLLKKADALVATLNELEALRAKLEALNDDSTILKSMDYVNLIEKGK
ncbi:hypothetical protein POF51_07705 [Brevibacillus sp. AG]|uniref:hypothetical protein n=1 Tax=Brevibacillus sp. AG TaxID=3020891 RepID=UPI00232FAA92|nr:hypothetical protein [Brevibacillus sp. AG]MDC0760571.1 hypothetical protein [Brevibacillus sp. AG]